MRLLYYTLVLASAFSLNAGVVDQGQASNISDLWARGLFWVRKNNTNIAFYLKDKNLELSPGGKKYNPIWQNNDQSLADLFTKENNNTLIFEGLGEKNSLYRITMKADRNNNLLIIASGIADPNSKKILTYTDCQVIDLNQIWNFSKYIRSIAVWEFVLSFNDLGLTSEGVHHIQPEIVHMQISSRKSPTVTIPYEYPAEQGDPYKISQEWYENIVQKKSLPDPYTACKTLLSDIAK